MRAALAAPSIASRAALAIVCLAACASPQRPHVVPAGSRVINVGQPGRVLAGVASRGATLFAATGTARPIASTTVEAFTSGVSSASWRAELAGFPGPLAVLGSHVIVALGGTGTVAQLPLRGEPGAALAALDATTGAVAWTLAIDATEWATLSAIAPTANGVLVGGTFSGTLRIADQVVSSGGRSDGFVACITATGAITWLRRVGGPGADSVAAVTATADRLAFAGTFAAGADLLGQPLAAFDERSVHADAFVAELDPAGTLRWTRTFGGKADEAIAGIAIDAAGHLVVAATVRETIHLGVADHVASATDGLVVWYLPTGEPDHSLLLGGTELDGLRAIAAVGDHVLVAGFYSGSLRLGDRTLTAAGGDDAFLVEIAPSGAVVQTWPVTGDGREEITTLLAIPGGFVAGISHTAAAHLDDIALPPPADPMSGASLVQRPIR